MATQNLLLTVKEAADRLGIGRTLMYSLIRTGEVRSVHIGRLHRVRLADLETYITGLAGGTPDTA